MVRHTIRHLNTMKSNWNRLEERIHGLVPTTLIPGYKDGGADHTNRHRHTFRLVFVPIQPDTGDGVTGNLLSIGSYKILGQTKGSGIQGKIHHVKVFPVGDQIGGKQ